MNGIMKYWPLITFLIGLTVVAAETRLTVNNNSDAIAAKTVIDEEAEEDLQQMQIWQATMDERTVNIIQRQEVQQQTLQTILDEVRK